MRRDGVTGLQGSSLAVFGRLQDGGEILLVTATIAFLVTLIRSSFMYLNRFCHELREAEAAR